MIRVIVFAMASVVTSTAMAQFDCYPSYSYSYPVYSQPVYTLPADYVYIRGITERTRHYEYIEYGEAIWKKVPVINGYVPDISQCRLASGGRKIIYDYSSRTTLEECRQCEPKEQPRKAKTKSSIPNDNRLPVPEDTDVTPVVPKPTRSNQNAAPKPTRSNQNVVPESDSDRPLIDYDMKKPSEVLSPDEGNRISPEYERNK